MDEIDLKEMFSYFLNNILIVVLITIAVITGGIVYRTCFKIPLYQSYTTIVLTRDDNNTVSDEGTGITQNDITLNQKLVATYGKIIKSRRVLEQVINGLNLDMKFNELINKVNVVNDDDTEIIKVTVTDSDKKEAKNIANKIAQVFSEEIVKIYSIKNISIIDTAIESETPCNINPTKETAILCIVGIFLGLGVVFIMYYLDTTIKNVDEIENKLGLVVLGSVPKKEFKGGSKK